MNITEHVSSWPTTYTVSLLPLWHPDCHTYAITVELRGGDYRGPAWAVCRHKWVLGSNGHWEVEPIPSGRDTRWLTQHRFHRDTALALARRHAPRKKSAWR